MDAKAGAGLEGKEKWLSGMVSGTSSGLGAPGDGSRAGGGAMRARCGRRGVRRRRAEMAAAGRGAGMKGAGATGSGAEGAGVGAKRPGAGAEGPAGAGTAANEPGAVSIELGGVEDRSAEAAVSRGLAGTAEGAGATGRGPADAAVPGAAGTGPAGAKEGVTGAAVPGAAGTGPAGAKEVVTGAVELTGIAGGLGLELDGVVGTRLAGAVAIGSMGAAANPVGARPKGAAAGPGRPEARTGAAVAAKEATFDSMVWADAVTGAGAKIAGRRGGRVP